MRDINPCSIPAAVKDSCKTEWGSRLKFLLETFAGHLHDYTRKMYLTPEEWMGVLMVLSGCGQISTPERHEVIPLSDVLGWSALMDMINTRGGATEGWNLVSLIGKITQVKKSDTFPVTLETRLDAQIAFDFVRAPEG
jgi:hydroxyquinol 1,2-dioxygenase